MSDLNKQAEELGIEVDGRWSDETLRDKIRQALSAPVANPDLPEPKEPMEPTREKTLHELNMEARRYDREMRGLNSKAAEAAKRAVEDTLAEKRPDGRRTRKPVRPVAE